VNKVDLLGSCDAGYSCSYTNTISWRTPSTPLPMENDPRVVFERLFGTAQSTDAQARLARIRRTASLLDSVGDELTRLRGRLGSSDRTKLSEYLESVRDVERRIQKAEEQNSRDLPVVEQPAGIPEDFAEHATLLGDLLWLAYQTDLTRVSTFMLANENSGRPYPEIGVPDAHHSISHHQNDPRNLDLLGQINLLHMRQFAHFIQRLQSTPDGDGTLLDHTILVYGAGISDSNTHFHDDLPVALVAGSRTGFSGGRHVRYERRTPVTNLWLTILDRLGVRRDTFGDSTGHLEV
jgi:hypothetical protein